MVKKIKYIILFLPFLFLTNVNAATLRGGNVLTPNWTTISSGYDNSSLVLKSEDIFPNMDTWGFSYVLNKYVYVVACSDMPTLGYSFNTFYNNTIGENVTSSDIRFTANLSSNTCTFTNGYKGKVVYLKFRLISGVLNVPTGSSDTTWLYNDQISLNIGTSAPYSFTIQSIYAIDDDLDIYSTGFDTSTLETQNQTIINQQNQNTNTIVDNQNQNTQEQIESQKVCGYPNLKGVVKPVTLGNNSDGTSFYRLGTSNSGIEFDVSSFQGKNITLSFNNLDTSLNPRANYCFSSSVVSSSTQTCISGSVSTSLTTSKTYNLTIPNNASYLYIIGYINHSNEVNLLNRVSVVVNEEVCKNGNQALDDSINNLTDSLTSTDTPNTNQDIEDMDNMLASDTPISDLIIMPLTLINAYINGINSTCSPVNLGNLYGTDLILPCLNLESRLGSNLWHIIDIFFCIFMCYNIGMLFITAFDGITSLRDDFEGLYQPRHADVGYQPKHGGGN